MYTLLNTNTVWAVNSLQATQGYYGGIPAGAIVVAAPPTVSQLGTHPIYYQLQPAWYTPVRSNVTTRSQLSSDGRFIPEGMLLNEVPLYNNNQILTPGIQTVGQGNSTSAQTARGVTYYSGSHSTEPSSDSQPPSSSGSPISSKDSIGSNTSLGSSTDSRKLKQSLDSLSMTSISNTSSSNYHKHDGDSTLERLFPASLCAALDEDPPEATAADPPLKTSSPIGEDNDRKSLLLDFAKFRKRKSRSITSSNSQKTPRFSDNGVCDDLDQCDKIIMRSREQKTEEEEARKREEFLLILEAERQRQRKLVLPKHAPKMSCKFCRNNGESTEVYTKHRLHYNEKTVCPILRHYVCRLCNSSGDFAHTIRHCPFNNRKDKIAWKATFLV